MPSGARAVATGRWCQARPSPRWRLTRPDCLNPMAHPRDRSDTDQWRAEVLDQVPTPTPAGNGAAPAIRRASVHASLAFRRGLRHRGGGASQAAGLIGRLSGTSALRRQACRPLRITRCAGPRNLAEQHGGELAVVMRRPARAAMRTSARCAGPAIPEATGFTAANGVVLSTQPGAE